MPLIKPKVIKSPRISANKLAEYIEAIPTRRRKIVLDSKYPSKFIVTRYADARETAKKYFCAAFNEDLVLDVISNLNEKDFDTPFQENDIRCSIEALESMLDVDFSILKDCEYQPFDEDGQYLEISNIQISVHPDLIITKNIADIQTVGALKLSIVKTNLSDEGQKLVSVMIHEYMKKYYAKDDKVINPKLCLSFDVFKQQLECCPPSHKHRLTVIEAACEEIALWWDKL